MPHKLNKVLLIDDSEADNFINTRVIRRAEVAEEIVTMSSGQEALDYLVTAVNGTFPTPDLVFLDINMPGMTGWEFLDAYERLPQHQRARIVVCMLTTSVANADEARAEGYRTVQAFSHKPLTQEMLDAILDEHFA